MQKDYTNMQKIKVYYNIRVCLYRINIKDMARCYLQIKEDIKDNLKDLPVFLGGLNPLSEN